MYQTAITLDNDTLAMLDESARFRSLSREEMLRTAIEESRADDLRLKAAVEEGRRCIARGDFYTQEQVEADNAILRNEIMGRQCG